jgi:hypothetical protein
MDTSIRDPGRLFRAFSRQTSFKAVRKSFVTEFRSSSIVDYSAVEG